jgi:hypothetical protein
VSPVSKANVSNSTVCAYSRPQEKSVGVGVMKKLPFLHYTKVTCVTIEDQKLEMRRRLVFFQRKRGLVNIFSI